MSWLDRLQVAKYTASNNVSQTFDYENVSVNYTNKGAAFEFPNAMGTYVQRSGSTGRKFPLRCYFHGTNYDQQADAFMELLRVNGVGKLQHPIYGTVDVVPLGTITRTDDLKTAASQAAINVTFLETTGLVFPTNQSDPESRVIFEMEQYYVFGSQQFADELNFETVEQQVEFKDEFTTELSVSKNALEDIVKGNAALLSRYNAVYSSVLFGIDDLLDDPVTLARQTLTFINIPSNATSTILAKFSAFSTLLTTLISAIPTSINNLTGRSLYGSGYVSSAVLSAVGGKFETKSEALDAAVFLLDMFDAFNTWHDDSLVALDAIDTGGGYTALQSAVAIAAGFLIDISFTLKQERLITLTAPRSMIELIYELYGELDEQYDFFISSNNLTGDEILEIPAGRTIRYYA